MTAAERRFVLAAIGDEGVVLDARTGEIYRADAAGVVVFRALAKGADVSGAAQALVRKFAVSRARAERDVRRILAAMRATPPRRRGTASQFRARSRGGYELLVDGRPVAWLDERGRTVEHSAGGHPSARILRLAAPHVLALAGHRVLHASAVVMRGEVFAFVAPSGTGKTTLARRLDGRGVHAISEDLLVLADWRAAVVTGESSIRDWARSRARTVDATDVIARVAGPTRPLRAVIVLERRSGQRGIVVERVRGADAIAMLFANAFVEVPCSRVWREALATCRALALRGVVHRARIPDGLSALDRALSARSVGRAPPRASDVHDQIEALLGARGSDPRMPEAVTA